MNDTLKDKILNSTDDGLDILEKLYPGAKENSQNPKKHFCQGINDTNPSCIVKKYDDEWKLINYGEDSKPLSAFDCYMLENGINNFMEACYAIADEFGVDIRINSEYNKPRNIEFFIPSVDEKDGDMEYTTKEFDNAELSVWGKKVTKEILAKYNYKAVDWYTRVYYKKDENGKPTQQLSKIKVTSSERYPIFVHECEGFQKFYIPYEFRKDRRFFYHGKRPADYVNGMREIEQSMVKDQKLPAIVICSGERDAMNAAAYGHYPIWFNSETSTILSHSFMRDLLEKAEKVINIPDIDDTGLKVAYKLANEYKYIYTCLLPNKLKTYKDHRGKPRKDLRDYLEIWPNDDELQMMLDNALKAEFWHWEGSDIKISTTNLLWFLKINGFYKYKDNVSHETKYVRIKDYTIKEYESKEIRDFVRNELHAMHVPNIILETYLNSKKCTAAIYDDLDTMDIDLSKATFDSRTFFFENKAIEVTKDSITETRNKDIQKYCWESNIVHHNFKRLDPCFTVENGSYTMKHINSNIFKVVINSSRLYWREEFENRITGNKEEDRQYRETYRFLPNGSRLTESEIMEQMLYIQAKCYAIGYILHSYKMPSRARALWLMDAKITEEGESSGGSGKSFIFETMKKLGVLNVVTLQGRDKRLTENNHFMDRVDASTDVVVVDDANEQLDFDVFYTMITNSITINPKGKASFEISFKEAPNVCFTSNFTPPRFDGSTKRRILPVIYSDYYHIKTPDNDYNETYTISNDFNNRELFEHDYTEEEYNQDINFLIDCLQFYLTMADLGIIIYPPMDKVEKRINQHTMGDGFKEWADEYFITNENINTFIVKDKAYTDYCEWLGKKGKPKSKVNFKKSLRSYAQFNGYEFNPTFVKGYRSGRITQTCEYNGEYKTQEMIYMYAQNGRMPAGVGEKTESDGQTVLEY